MRLFEIIQITTLFPHGPKQPANKRTAEYSQRRYSTLSAFMWLGTIQCSIRRLFRNFSRGLAQMDPDLEAFKHRP